MLMKLDQFDGANETPAKSGCLETLVALFVATLGAFVVGVGICAGGFAAPIYFTPIFQAIWLGISFIVAMIVFILILKNF